ncbi:Protein of unknown function [Gryllus bimaculatus]|nr:Protein of unknown function [Gryllus bimaculatus]
MSAFEANALKRGVKERSSWRLKFSSRNKSKVSKDHDDSSVVNDSASTASLSNATSDNTSKRNLSKKKNKEEEKLSKMLESNSVEQLTDPISPNPYSDAVFDRNDNVRRSARKEKNESVLLKKTDNVESDSISPVISLDEKGNKSLKKEKFTFGKKSKETNNQSTSETVSSVTSVDDTSEKGGTIGKTKKKDKSFFGKKSTVKKSVSNATITAVSTIDRNEKVENPQIKDKHTYIEDDSVSDSNTAISASIVSEEIKTMKRENSLKKGKFFFGKKSKTSSENNVQEPVSMASTITVTSDQEIEQCEKTTKEKKHKKEKKSKKQEEFNFQDSVSASSLADSTLDKKAPKKEKSGKKTKVKNENNADLTDQGTKKKSWFKKRDKSKEKKQESDYGTLEKDSDIPLDYNDAELGTNWEYGASNSTVGFGNQNQDMKNKWNMKVMQRGGPWWTGSSIR